MIVNLLIRMNNQEINKTLKTIAYHFPQRGALELDDPYRSLVAVLLSARTKDEQVLKLLPDFFQAYPSVYELAESNPADMADYLKTIGMFRQKAKNLHALAHRVIDKFNGEIPDNLEDMITLPGVGRKTASVVLPYIFNKPAIAVDVHVHRVANRLSWVNTNTPAKTESALLQKIPEENQAMVNQSLVKFGRYICTARNPKCSICPIADICPFKDKNLKDTYNKQEVYDKINQQEEEIARLRKLASK